MAVGYELVEEPTLDQPVLLLGLEGWVDAGFASNNAAATLLTGLDTRPLAVFDADELLDHRARRPVMHLVDGVNTGLSWPGIELRVGTDLDGTDLLFLAGAEPDHSWRAFSAAVLDLCQRFGVRIAIGLGAFPAGVPHTRPVRLSCTANSAELAARWPFQRGSIEVPAGVHAAIERACADAGLPAIGLWAQVPHYAAAMPYPAASAALLRGVALVGGLTLPAGDLEREGVEAVERIDGLVAENPEHAAMVRALEAAADEQPVNPSLPTGDELAAEFEQFLREQGDED